jgi:transcriptional regulator with XRE-family HTH domain
MNYKDYFKKFENDKEYTKAKEELRPLLDIADEILRLRLEKGWSQAELAEHAETKQANISRLESGMSNPSVKFLQKLAKALDTNISIHFEKIPAREIYINTDTKNQSQEAYPVANWPKARIYQSYGRSSS